jgi:hypothetical protein
MKNLPNTGFYDSDSPEVLMTMSWPKLDQLVCQNYTDSYKEDVVKYSNKMH